MKKVIKLSLVISLAGMLLASCSNPSVTPSEGGDSGPSANRLSVPGYYSDTQVTNLESNAELVYNEEINDIFFFEYKIGSIKNCFIQSLFTPIYNDGNIQKMTFTASDITSESISKGVTNSVSVTNTTSVTNTQSTTNIDWKFTLEVPKDTVKAITKMATLQDPKSALSLGASGTINKTTNTTSQTVTESLTKSANESHDITSFNQKCKQVSYDFDFTKYETGKYYTLGLIANIDVYQVVAYDKVEDRFYASYFYTDINENNTAIKVLSSDNLEFELPEEVKIHPISSLGIDNTYIGDGSFSNPYQICSPVQFVKIKNDPGACYLLKKDLDMGASTLNMIDYFSGVLDGNGHAIYNFKVTGNTSKGIALINTNDGVIKNLQIGKAGYETSFNNDYTKKEVDTSDVYVSSIVYKNSGDIINCQIDSITVDSSIASCGVCKNNYGLIYKLLMKNSHILSDGFWVYGGVLNNYGTVENVALLDNYFEVLKGNNQELSKFDILLISGLRVYKYALNCEKNSSSKNVIVANTQILPEVLTQKSIIFAGTSNNTLSNCLSLDNSNYISLVSANPDFDSVVDPRGRRVWRADENGKISLTFYNLD